MVANLSIIIGEITSRNIEMKIKSLIEIDIAV